MKKTIITACLLLVGMTTTVSLHAQWTADLYGTYFSDGYSTLGIGNPAENGFKRLTGQSYDCLSIEAGSDDILGPLIRLDGMSNTRSSWMYGISGLFPGSIDMYSYNSYFFLTEYDPAGPGKGLTIFEQFDATAGYKKQLTIDHLGNIAMGDVMPTSARLSVEGDLLVGRTSFPFNGKVFGGGPAGLNIYSYTDNTDGTGIRLYDDSTEFITHGQNAGRTGFKFTAYDPTSHTSKNLVRITQDGKLVVGSDIMVNIPTPTDYNMYVSKGILTEKVKVALSSTVDWSDFVFNKDYNLMPLHKVETFINENKHLPDVPSATEVVANGIDVANMDAKLLQKIEELTLYVIQQQKQIETQQQQINELRKN